MCPTLDKDVTTISPDLSGIFLGFGDDILAIAASIGSGLLVLSRDRGDGMVNADI